MIMFDLACQQSTTDPPWQGIVWRYNTLFQRSLGDALAAEAKLNHRTFRWGIGPCFLSSFAGACGIIIIIGRTTPLSLSLIWCYPGRSLCQKKQNVTKPYLWRHWSIEEESNYRLRAGGWKLRVGGGASLELPVVGQDLWRHHHIRTTSLSRIWFSPGRSLCPKSKCHQPLTVAALIHWGGVIFCLRAELWVGGDASLELSVVGHEFCRLWVMSSVGCGSRVRLIAAWFVVRYAIPSLAERPSNW